MKPSFTLTYGLGWTLEMPPTEAQGKQIELVDSSGQQLAISAYLKQRESAALNGQVYNPEIGFALVGNTGPGQKYPYLPFYGSFSPRIAAAWNPNFSDGWMGKVFGGNKTVIRGGYGRVYGRLNGVDLVLVPLLGTGLIQAVQCRNNNMDGTCSVPTGPHAPPQPYRHSMRSASERTATTPRFRLLLQHFLSRPFQDLTPLHLALVKHWTRTSAPTWWTPSISPFSGSWAINSSWKWDTSAGESLMNISRSTSTLFPT